VRLSVVRPGRSKCRTAVFRSDGVPYRVRHVSLGQGRWTAGSGWRQMRTVGNGEEHPGTAGCWGTVEDCGGLPGMT